MILYYSWKCQDSALYQLCYLYLVHTAIMCSEAVKFLSITIACIVLTDGELLHEEWKRQSNVSESTSTTSEYTF